MRICRLDLKAFGPFTDKIIEFNSKKPGLHIIYGPNEAGKSSSLRALKALLFGFPERTSDNFIHANKQLLVGGSLVNERGEKLEIQRRKKRVADLLDVDGNPLDHKYLSAFMDTLDPTLFETLYGIDQRSLVAGGEEILARKGEVGQALFAAGTGISALAVIMDSIDSESSELFKERGSKQQINQAVKIYKDLKKSLKESSLLPGKWTELQKRMQELEAEHALLEERSQQDGSEIHKLERLYKAVPELARLENLQQQLLDLGTVVLLPPDFSQQHTEVEQLIRENSLKIEQDREQLKRLRSRTDENSINAAIIDHAEVIEDLHQRLDRYRNGLDDKVRLEGMRIAYRKDAGALIESIRAGIPLQDAETLRPLLSKRRTIQTLSSRYESVHQRKHQASKQKLDVEKELETISAAKVKLPKVKNIDSLKTVIRLAQRAGDIDELISTINREIEVGRINCRSDLSQLGLWNGELQQMLSLHLPLAETIRTFENGYDSLSQEHRQIKDEQRKIQEDLAVAKRNLKEVLAGEEVPSEQKLQQVRNRRLDGWLLLKRRWLDGENVVKEAAKYDPEKELHLAYELQVDRADRVADRLRHETRRVAEAATLEVRIKNLTQQIKRLAEQEEDHKVRNDDFSDKWRETWKSAEINPLSPREMSVWLTEFGKIRFRLQELAARQSEKSAKEEERNTHRLKIIDELKKIDEQVGVDSPELAPLLIFAQSVLDTHDQYKVEQEQLATRNHLASAQCVKARSELLEAESNKTEWQREWYSALSGLKIEEPISPAEALDLLETLEACFDKLEKAKDLQSRIDGIERDVKAFLNDIQALVDSVAPELRQSSPDQVVLKLYALLAESREKRELFRERNKEIDRLISGIGDLGRVLPNLDVQMSQLLAIAQCNKSSELGEAIRKSSEYQRLQDKISDAESTLAKVSEGLPPEQIKEQTARINVDEIPARIETLKRRLNEELRPQIENKLKLIGEVNKELQLMDGGDRAAEKAEKMEQTAAKIQHLVEQYTRLTLASTLLKNEIERYREKHQGPILQSASKIFAQLTLGSFSGLRADIDDESNPVLAGLRPDGTRVLVEGMSDGTCDQLFLALRLATLESRLVDHEPMPFIVDDVLINFDDHRSSATLERLADISNRNQVILFTHHRQVVEQAENVQTSAEIVIHDLSS